MATPVQTTVREPRQPKPKPKATGRIRLEYLDGLRGIAALYVMLGHLYVTIRPSIEADFPRLMQQFLKLLDYGHYAVAVFIVLSGYVLMLPVARSTTGQMRGTTLDYIKRRARRIMPPYYAALVISILILVIFPRVDEAMVAYQSLFYDWSDVNQLSWQSILSHALLVHNLHPVYTQTINGPMWSVSTEWQIYFLLPLVFLPVWRRGGTWTLIGTGFLLGWAPHFLLPEAYNFDWTFPWYIGLFTMGMGAAVINFSTKARLRQLRQALPWGWLALGAAGLTGYMLVLQLEWSWENIWLSDPLVGLATALIIIASTRSVTQEAVVDGQEAVIMAETARPGPIVQLLDTGWGRTLGAFSYSLYLMHMPLVYLVNTYLDPLFENGFVRLGIQFAIIAPLLIGVCYLFYLAFELPTIKRKK